MYLKKILVFLNEEEKKSELKKESIISKMKEFSPQCFLGDGKPLQDLDFRCITLCV